MTREESRKIRRTVRTITAELVDSALAEGLYHAELEKRMGHALKIGTETAYAANQACAEEAAILSNRVER